MAALSGNHPPIMLDVGTLTPVMRAALHSDSATVIEWSAAPLRSGDVHFGGGSLLLVAGTAANRGTTTPWKAVLKAVARDDDGRAMDPSSDPADYAYWKREPLAFASGALQNLPGGLVAPECYGVVEREPDHYWIWLEHIPSEEPWTLDRYRAAAKHLGAFNGAYLAGVPQPIAPWAASTRSIQSYWGTSHPFLSDALELINSPDSWQRDEIRRAIGRLDLHALGSFFADEGRYVRALERLPQTFCHNDAMRPNLFARRAEDGSDRTIAVDWQVAGRGPIGAELSMLVAGSVLFFNVPAADVDELAAQAWAGYLSGLDAAGCRCDPNEARFGFVASVTARCGLLAATWLRNALDDPVQVERVWGRSASEVVAQTSLLASFLDRRAAEAQQLLG